MAAQHLLRDLVRPGSGSEEFAQTMKNDMPSHTKHSFTSSASSHHAERIYCNITESWKLQSVVSPPQENVPTPLYYKFSVPLNFLLISLSYALGQHSVIRTNHFLSLPCTKLNPLVKLCGFPHRPR